MSRESSRAVRLLISMVLIWSFAPGSFAFASEVEVVKVVKDATGQRLQVEGRDFMVLGMNWDYSPIGTNYEYSLWTQPDAFIKQALDYEMGLLKNMGVNSLRLYNGVPPKWVQYIWETYGIYSIINHPMLRYGYTVDGAWIPAPNIDYSDARLRELVTEEIVAIVKEFEDTPGVLMWMLGNENNYQLTWSSTEIEALPEGEQQSARALHLYTLFEDVTKAIKQVDTKRPVALCNGDLAYIDIIAAECKTVDIFATNVYRGISARDLYAVVEEKLDKPIVYAEFGSDAYNAKEKREDQFMQAYYLIGQWREIYEQSAGKGLVGNCIGGMTFQWSDGWWKTGQTEDLDKQSTNATWPNGGYYDFVEGGNNMNEEWWGITAKGFPNAEGFFELYPRAAYYALEEAYELDPYAPTTDLRTIREHFAAITPAAATLQARGDTAARTGGESSKVRVSGVRMEFETYSTGGKNIATKGSDEPRAANESFLGFDRMESYFVDFEATPAPPVTGHLSLSILGNVPRNPIDEIFYENRGRSPQLLQVGPNRFVPEVTDTTLTEIPGVDRVKVYQASVNWDDDWFNLHGFYRTGHAHWAYEGDFFGLYPEAFYGENVDIYNGMAPYGVEVTGKRDFDGVKFAFGPELWWGANPAYLVKVRRQVLGMTTTMVYHEDFADRPSAVVTSSAIPQRDNRRATIAVETTAGPFGLEVGGIWSGSTEIDETFNGARKSGDSYELYSDQVDPLDTLGGKLRMTWSGGRYNWYGEGAVQGLVASGGVNSRQNFTGWALKDSGLGNKRLLTSGLTVQAGKWQVGPNVMWQKPFEGPVPRELLLTELRNPIEIPGIDALGSRSIQSSPFAVRENRETLGAEVVLTYDETPGSWLWAWNNDVREDASLAWSLRYTFRHQPTTQDAALFVSEGGDIFPFPGAPPAKDLWELQLRVVSKISSTSRVVWNAYGGPVQATGNVNEADEFAAQINRTVKRFGTDVRYLRNSLSLTSALKVNDWGPYDYHRDFNLTFPLQLIGDVSYTLGTPRWFADQPQTRVGVRVTWRTLDEFSNRYEPVEDLTSDEDEDGREWEIRTYLHLAM